MRFKCSLLTVVNEHGYLVLAEMCPSDGAQYVHDGLRDMYVPSRSTGIVGVMKFYPMVRCTTMVWCDIQL